MALERINLVPQKPIAAKLKRITVAVIGGLFGIIVIVLACQYYLLNLQLGKEKSGLTAIETQINRAAQFQVQEQILTQDIAALNKKFVQIKSEVAQISAIGRDKRKLSNILACLAKALPDSVRFNSISIQKDSAKITGTASQYKDLPGFVDTLRKDAQFNRVTLQDIDRDRSVAKDRYSYTILFKLN